jgi:hypothetical protein
MVGFPYAHKSRAFERKPGAASRNTWSGLLGLSTSRPGKRPQARPEVVLVNSHDKSSAYQLHCGLFRLVCTNGMVVFDGTFQRISIKHSGFNPDSVIEASFKVLTAVPDIMNQVQLFRIRNLTDSKTLFEVEPK